MTGSFSSLPDPLPVPAGRRASGRLRPPSSKSLTQRYYNLALLAEGPTVVDAPLRSEDCDCFLAGLLGVGCRVEDEGERVTIEPPAAPGSATIDCGASGTMMRLLTASLCAVPGRWRLDGVARLRERPLGALLASLRELGAQISELGEAGHAPLELVGGSLKGGAATVTARQSSQYVSALLMAATGCGRRTSLRVEGIVSRPYVDLTLAAMSEFGASLEIPGADRFVVDPVCPRGIHASVEADASAACYPAAAAALTGGEVTIEGLERCSVQGDLRFFDLLANMGANVHWSDTTLRVDGTGALRALDVDLSSIPDQVPTLAALAPFAEGTTVIRNVPHLRLKESDRLQAMAVELERLGVPVVEKPDGLEIVGCWAGGNGPSDAVTVETWDDHRIAMSCALVGLRRKGVSVARPQVVSKSYPAFWRDLGRLME